MKVADFEFGYKKYRKLKKQNNYHILHRTAHKYLAVMVKFKRKGLTKEDYLFNVVKYYDNAAKYYEYGRNLVLTMLIPLYITVVALKSVMNFSNVTYFFIVLSVIVISLRFYHHYSEMVSYYLFYLDIVKEYINKINTAE